MTKTRIIARKAVRPLTESEMNNVNGGVLFSTLRKIAGGRDVIFDEDLL